MDKKVIAAFLAKAALLDLNQGEIKFLQYQLGISGGFYTGLFDLYWKADRVNKGLLMMTWPQEMEAAERYAGEDGYWEALQKKAGL